MKKHLDIQKIFLYFAHAKRNWLFDRKQGSLTERLGTGLQNRLRRFESARNLSPEEKQRFPLSLRSIRTVPWMSGLVSGLQNHVRQFESARHLPEKSKWYYIRYLSTLLL